MSRRIFSRPVHVCVERRLTLVTYVQATLDALAVVFSTAHTTRLVLLVSRSDTSTTSIPSTFALYVSIDVNRSNAHAHPCKSSFPCFPQFVDSPFSSSRTPLSSPILSCPTFFSTHCSMMCFPKEWKKWVRRSDHFACNRVGWTVRHPSRHTWLFSSGSSSHLV